MPWPLPSAGCSTILEVAPVGGPGKQKGRVDVTPALPFHLSY